MCLIDNVDWNREIGDAIENDRLKLYMIHSAEDYFGSIAKFQLLDEAPSVSLFTIMITRRILLLVHSHQLFLRFFKRFLELYIV